MKKINHSKCVVARLALIGLLGALPVAYAAAAIPESVKLSTDPTVAAAQQEVYKTVHSYETLLNAGNTAEIVKLYASDGVSEWNEKRTFATKEQMTQGYDSLFKIAKFTTKFSYDAIEVVGDTAFVRTHHHKGATVVENGKTLPDLNREVFLLQKIDGSWKIK